MPRQRLQGSELHELRSFMSAREQRRKAPKIKVKSRSGKPLKIDMQDVDAVRFLSAFGTAEQGFAFLMFNGIVNAACDRGQPEAGAIHNALAAVTGIGARDETEAMLATQMVAPISPRSEFYISSEVQRQSLSRTVTAI
jgi:pyrroline-5-carboxylate reductase